MARGGRGRRLPSSAPEAEQPEEALARILRTVSGISRKAAATSSQQSTCLWPHAVLEALDSAVASCHWESALEIFELMRKQRWYEPKSQTYARLLMMLGRSGRGCGRIGGGSSPPRPPVFRSEAEHAQWLRSEGTRKRSARRWTNWGLTPPGKLARYANSGEGSSSGGSCSPPVQPLPDSSSDDEEDAPPLRLTSGDYVHEDAEEVTVIQQVTVISETEARARFRREEQDTVRQVMVYEAAQKEACVRHVKRQVVYLDEE